jgi:hypothetical protein
MNCSLKLNDVPERERHVYIEDMNSGKEGNERAPHSVVC